MTAYKFTPEVKERFLELLRNGTPRAAALLECGVTRYTLYNHIKEDEEFAEAIAAASAQAVECVEDALYEKCLRGHAESIKFFLCNRAPKRWSPTNKISIDASGGLSLEEMESTIERLIEYAIRFIPDAKRGEFFDGLRGDISLSESGRQSLLAPSDS